MSHRAERIVELVEDEGMSRREAVAWYAQFEDHGTKCSCIDCEQERYPHFDTQAERDA